jgi:N-carbamoylputrescine amidase
MLRVAIGQMRVTYSDPMTNMSRVMAGIKWAAVHNADMVYFPETCLIGWTNPDAHHMAKHIPGEYSQVIAHAARRYRITVGIGLTEKVPRGIFDSSLLIDPNGKILIKYHKIHIMDDFMKDPYKAGNLAGIQVVDTPMGRIGTIICADSFYPDSVDAMAALHPDLVFVPYGWIVTETAAASPSGAPAGTATIASDGQGTSTSSTSYTLADVLKYCAPAMSAYVVGVDAVGTIVGGLLDGYSFSGGSAVADRQGNIIDLAGALEEMRLVELPLPAQNG